MGEGLATPKLDKRLVTFIILRAPGLAAPTRVATSLNTSRSSPGSHPRASLVSHSFPSLCEGKVYCLAAGIDFPEPRSR